jgi:hypothetical protein
LRHIACFDIPGAFLHAKCEDGNVFMLLKGKLAELMTLVEPKLYRQHVRYDNEKGEAMLYVKMSKALYGMLKSALWFYKKLKVDLEHYGFIINPYDPCVANAMINGKQMTVTWHVDDLKVSHEDPAEITKFANYLAVIYGERLTVHRGLVHDYLGMDLDYTTKGKVGVSMIKYVDKVLEGFSEELGASAATPAAEHLFQVRNDSEAEILSEMKAQEFHHITAQLLFLSARARRDIQVAVAFLTTRVKKPDTDDWGKLRRVLKYLKGTKYMKLLLSIDDLSKIMWWVDASDRTHEDCKGHTGAMMSLGGGAVISSSRKQKINTKSSTESELVALDDALTTILWTLYFIEAQGYSIEQNIIFEDNMSTINLAVNGTFSSSKRTKHIKARYFFIKDKIEEGEVEIRYCPTEKMWSDVLNKPKQGGPFRKDRAMLMGVPEEYDDNVEYRKTHQELLPNSDKENLDDVRAPDKPTSSSRSVLGEVGNSGNIPGVLKHADTARNSGNRVSWSDVVRRNL